MTEEGGTEVLGQMKCEKVNSLALWKAGQVVVWGPSLSGHSVLRQVVVLGDQIHQGNQ